MNIFCRETQAHLALHGLASISSNNPTTAGALITPELWLRDCRSPPPSPDVDETLIVDDEPASWSTGCGETDKEESRSDGLPKDNQNRFPIDRIVLNVPGNEVEDQETDAYHEETEEAIKESLKEEEDRRCQERKNEADCMKLFSSSIPLHDINASRKLRSSPESSKESLDNCLREGTIYLKDMRKLLGRDKLGKTIRQTPGCRPRKISKSPTWLAESHMTFQPPTRGFPVHHRPFLSHPMPLKFTPQPGNMPAPPPITMRPPPLHSLPPKIPPTNPQTSLLPPVTILVPYLIPIPFPLPLPIPIPLPLFAKFFNSRKHEQYEMRNDTTDNNETVSAAPEDLSQRSKTINLQSKIISQNLTSTNIEKSNSDSSTSSSPSSSCINFTTKTNQELPVLPSATRTTRPLRKRRRQSGTPDESDIRLKRRSKFVPV